MRVYEFSKKYDKSNKELLDLLHEGGFDVGSHMSVLSDDAVQYLKAQLGLDQKDRAKAKVVVKSVSDENVDVAPEAPEEIVASVATPVQVRSGVKLALRAMTLGDLADAIGVPASSLILFLLKQGVVCNRNQMLTQKQVASVANQFDVQILQPDAKTGSVSVPEKISGGSERLPVVVVIGHVDHGKTTLLDFIRKTRVAAREAGGITQHLGAYRVDSASGALIFLDTPGHEAFSAIRKRGLRAADIAILMVAADDGVMPQTVEAIRQAQEVGLPIVVAINKVDKANSIQIEKVKKQLTQYGITPEEWGGETIFVEISAKNGTNVDQLLEMLSLQAEMMELRTNLDIPACGYVLEARMERGRGPVATFIGQHGKLKQGNFFVCGSVAGKVVSLKNYAGDLVNEVGPSVPVGIAGFEELPSAGDFLRVVDEVEYRKFKSGATRERAALTDLSQDGVADETSLKIYVKADTFSSEEAVIGAIKRLSQAHSQKVLVLRSEVGDINEGDIGYADSIGASIYGFGVKLTSGASALAKGLSVSVHLFNIIYKLTDFLESLLSKQKVVKVAPKKVGEALVKKVFDIKGVGVVAGVAVKKGRIGRGFEAIVMRDGRQVARGLIDSLQKDRKAVKEITAGYEGAFMIANFTDWQEDDVVECFLNES